MTKKKGTDYFLKLAQDLAKNSGCLKTQVGAVLVKDGIILSTSYNRPEGIWDCETCKFPDSHCEIAIHAEEKAISRAIALGKLVKGSTLYCTHLPCINCAMKLRIFGVERVVYINGYIDNRILHLPYRTSHTSEFFDAKFTAKFTQQDLLIDINTEQRWASNDES